VFFSNFLNYARITLVLFVAGAQPVLVYGQTAQPVTSTPITTAPITTPPVGIQQGGSLIGPSDLPTVLSSILQTLGGRLTSASAAQVHLVGTTTDASGSRSAQITIQSPGLFSYQEAEGRSIIFNGTTVQTNAGAPTVEDEPILESLLSNFPDMAILQAANGGGVRKIAIHARTDDGKSATYSGPYWTVLEFAPVKRAGFAWGEALQQELFICIDEKTRLISEVRRVVRNGTGFIPATQTQFQNWFQQGTQWFPGKIIRLEGGVQTLSFQVQTAAAGAASAVTAFQP
jgi:hypothetical protein